MDKFHNLQKAMHITQKGFKTAFFRAHAYLYTVSTATEGTPTAKFLCCNLTHYHMESLKQP